MTESGCSRKWKGPRSLLSTALAPHNWLLDQLDRCCADNINCQEVHDSNLLALHHHLHAKFECALFTSKQAWKSERQCVRNRMASQQEISQIRYQIGSRIGPQAGSGPSWDASVFKNSWFFSQGAKVESAIAMCMLNIHLLPLQLHRQNNHLHLCHLLWLWLYLGSTAPLPSSHSSPWNVPPRMHLATTTPNCQVLLINLLTLCPFRHPSNLIIWTHERRSLSWGDERRL